MASASSSSAMDQQLGLVNFRVLCHDLEAGLETSKEAVRRQLQIVIPVFRACGKNYPSSLASSKEKASSDGFTLASGKVIPFDEQQKALHKTISQLHQLSESEVTFMLRTFFDTDDSNLDLLLSSSGSFVSPLQQKSTGRKRRIAKDSEDFTTKFFDAFTAFYFEERLYILHCISTLIRIAGDSYHGYSDIAIEILDQFADQHFALNCLAHFQQLCQQELLDQVREVPRYSVFWSKHGLREQLALFEVIFLLYYSRLDTTAEVVKALFQVIKVTDFGKEQACAGFFDAEASQLVDCIGSFLVLLSVESLELEKCMEGLDLHSTNREVSQDSSLKQLIDAPDVVGHIADYLLTSTQADVLRAPLLLSFALLLMRIDEAMNEWQEARSTESYPVQLEGLQAALAKRGGVGILWPDLINAALTPTLDIFGTLNTIITSPLFCTDTPISNLFTLPISSSLALRAVFKGLVLSITYLIRPEYTNDTAGLIRLWKNTFTLHISDSIKVGRGSTDNSVAALCAQFWEVDYDHGNGERRAVLNMVTRRFPASFSPLLSICQALSGESSEIDDYSLRASTAVLGYLAQLTTLSQVMPASPSLSLPYEPVEVASHSSGTTYRATRDIPVFGKHLVVPTGTFGQLVSSPNQVPIVILWEMQGVGFSAWRLLRDVLASFVSLLDTSTLWKSASHDPDENDSAVFHDKEPVASFSALSPEVGTGLDGEVAADALELLCTILDGGRYLSATLLSHLDGEDIGIAELSQPTALLPKPNLIDITLRLLNQSLVNPTLAPRLILACLRILKLLIPSASAAIWQAMRSSNALIGSSGSLPFSSQKSGFRNTSTSLLSHEISIGHFPGTLALLDLHMALLHDLQKTQYSSSTEALQLKVDVMSRAAHFTIHYIWIEYQTWKYISTRQQIELGRRCVSFFDQIYRDDGLRASPMTAKLVELIGATFLSSASSPSLVFKPLLRTISHGQRFITLLQRGMRQIDAELAKKQLQACLCFVLTIINRQTFEGTIGALESYIFGQSSMSSSNGNLVENIASLTLITHSYSITVEAVKLMTCLCRSTASLQSTVAPTLIGHLGSLQDVEKLVNGLLDNVSGADSNSKHDLAVQTWNLLAALVDMQPALATLLLTGRHLAESVEKQLASLGTPSEESLIANSMTQSAIDIAKSAVLGWSNSFKSKGAPEVLEGALKFLDAAFKHALEHQEVFATLRSDQDFWTAISQLAQADTDELPKLPPNVMMESGSEDESDNYRCKSDASEAVCRFAYKRRCSARALELLTSDITFTPLLTKAAKNGHRGLAFDRIMSMLSNSESLASRLRVALTFPCDALMHEDVFARLSQTFPELSLEDFCMAPRRDDFDYLRTFGDNYLYDVDLLQKKLQGFAPSVDEEMEEETQLAALQQAVLLVAGLNLNWCIIDAQSSYLQAWTALLKGMMGPMSQSKSSNVALSAWIKCAKIASSEDIESQVTNGIHTKRIELLSVLLKLSWSGKNESNEEELRDVMDQLEHILTHSVFRVEDAVRNRAAFPRPVFEMIYLSVKRYCHVRQRLASQSRTDQGKANLLRSLQQSAETLTLQTISCLRAIIDNAWAYLSTKDERREEWKAEAEQDLHLLASILSILLSPASGVSPHIWAPRLQTTSLLSTMVDLFSRSPLQQNVSDIESAQGILAIGAIPVFSSSLLTFFFHLASQRSTAELLVLADIINGLNNNTLSAIMDASEEAIPSRLANTSYENPTHTCWLQMLQIVVALLDNLTGPIGQRFMQTEAWSFFKVYEGKLNQSLEIHFPMRGALLHGRGNLIEGIRVNQLEEVDLILKIYLNIVQARMGYLQEQKSDGNNESPQTIFTSYIDKVSVQLQKFVHLLQHPREMTALLAGSRAKGEEKEEERVRVLLTSCCASIVSSLWEISRGSQVLCTEPTEWNLGQTIISSTISTTPTSPSSTGTLLDFATYLVETILRNRSDKDKTTLSFWASILEQTLSLCTTQIVLAAYVSSNPYATTVARKDVETGLGRDVKQGLESAKGAIQSAAIESTSFMDVLLQFHTRWLHGSD